jgi:hypothetical protein
MSWLEVAAACHKDRVRRMRNKPNPEMLRSQELEKAKSRSHQSEATRALLRAVTYFEQVYERRQAGALFLSSRGFADNHGHHNPAAANLIDYLADWVLCIRRTLTPAGEKLFWDWLFEKKIELSNGKEVHSDCRHWRALGTALHEAGLDNLGEYLKPPMHEPKRRGPSTSAIRKRYDTLRAKNVLVESDWKKLRTAAESALPSLKEIATKKPAALRGEPADSAIGFDFAYWLSLQNIESPTPMFAPLFGM